MQVVIHTSGEQPAAGTRCGLGLELAGSANTAGPILLANEGGAFFGQVGGDCVEAFGGEHSAPCASGFGGCGLQQ